MSTTTAEAEPELELIRYDATCSRCRRLFRACAVPDPFNVTRPVIRKLACDPCVELVRRESAQRHAESRAENSLERRRAKEWEELCPRAYRTIEEQGATALAKLAESQSLLSLARTYEFGFAGLLFRGESGTAKTRVMWRVLRAQFDQGRSIKAFTPGEFERAFRDAAGNHKLDEWFDALAVVDCLFLDDLGKSRWSQNTVETFFDLVEKRTNAGRPMFITSNYNRETLAVKLSLDRDEAEPMLRRLLENCDCRLFKKA
jgi:DNA replication protein DnaC